jgi:precorrin-2/cobalt-factor-2 C20-methyltransferase
MKTGKLTAVGVGPGDPELITLKGLRCLQSAGVVAFPQGRDGAPGFAHSIARTHLRPEQRLLPLFLPFVQDAAVLERSWKEAADRLAAELDAGWDVAYLCEGDVSFFSTFTYLLWEFQARHSHAIEIVPGICSPLAAAAALQIPLGIADERIAVLPAMHRLADLAGVARHFETLVLLKVAPVYPQVHAWVHENGLEKCASVLSWVSGEREQIHRTLPPAEHKLPYFSLLILRMKRCVP